MLYTADFETTTDINDCRVWAWGVCEIDDPSVFHYGNDIEGFIDFCKKSKNSTFYFHNERFDGEFLFSWLFRNGFRHTINDKEKDTKTFNTLISDMGLFYAIEIVFEKKGKKYNSVKIYDSLKIIPFSIDQVAKAFGLPINKLKIDYKEFRPVGHELTKHEVNYLRHDVEIAARALSVLFSQGLTKITQGANAMADYQSIIGKKNFSRWFPSPDRMMDKDLRQCYKGGFTFIMKRYKERSIREGLVFDVNSLYPWAMYTCPLPCGSPIFYKGQYEYDEIYPLYIQMIRCTRFKVKDGYIPTMQIKDGDYPFPSNEYLEDTEPYMYIEKGRGKNRKLVRVETEEIVICLTSVDLELFLEHYDIENLEYLSGWKFRQQHDMFKDYIDKWMAVKIESTKNGNKGMRTLSKLMLNSLYGKFAAKLMGASKYPYMDEEDGSIHYKTGGMEERKAYYVPVAAFVTAWARHKTITTAQKLYKYFVYADTDSLHLDIPLPNSIKNLSQKELENLTTKDLIEMGLDLPEDFEVDPSALGAWKLESVFRRARFLRQKSYIEDSNPPHLWGKHKYSTKHVKQFCEDMGLDFDKEIAKYSDLYDVDKFKITCAGMSSRCYPYVNWDNFNVLSSFKGKLDMKHVNGGIVLVEGIFTIRPS